MSLEIVIDGYNLINKWNLLKEKFRLNPEEAREFLIDILAHYKKIKKHQIQLVFDAYNSFSLLPSSFPAKGIKVVFTPMGVNADTYIKRKVVNHAEKFIVVTSDNEIKKSVEKSGSVFINSEDFINKLEFAFYMDVKGIDDSFDNYSPRLNTKKKGNPKKLPKKARKFKHKINKL